MPTIVLRFPGGRYHATPGGHHVNEGIVEWPPSPWRLVRALIACGYATQHWESVPSAGRRLVESLSSTLPEYRLPPAALGHSRHYMPMARMKEGREETTLVLDSFADVGDGELWVRWATTLDEEARRLFDTLVAHLGYLGRSESWVTGESVADDRSMPIGGRAVPHSDLLRAGKTFEQVALRAPELAEEYALWRKREVDEAIVAAGLANAKSPAQRKKIDAIEAAFPLDLIECLQRDTAWWKAHKWSRPPGARSVLYWRERGGLEVGPPAAARPPKEHRVEAALLALTTPSGSRSALPTLPRTLPQAELLHQALVSKAKPEEAPCPELVGRDAARVPLKGHQHAHILPVDLDADGHIDHILVFARMGLGSRALRAVRATRKTYMKGGAGELQVAVAGTGALEDLRAIAGGLGAGVEHVLGPRGGTTLWTSASPYVPPRHLKVRGRSSLEGQIQEELASRGLPPARIEVLKWDSDTLSLRHFVRRRQRGPQPPQDVCVALRLEFEGRVVGPICLGYGAHFGLGRFRAE